MCGDLNWSLPEGWEDAQKQAEPLLLSLNSDQLRYIGTICFFEADSLDNQRQMLTHPRGYVYVLKAGEYYKIGRTKHPEERIKTLKIQLPFPVELVALFPCENPEASEKRLHDLHEDKRCNGEWFRLTEGQAQHLADISISPMSWDDGFALFHEEVDQRAKVGL